MAVIRARLAVAVLLAGLAAAACTPRSATPGDKGDAMSDEVFDKVALDTFAPSAGTPAADEKDFSGIRIAMPAKVPAGRLSRLPLCGVWAFDGEKLSRYPAMIEDSLVFLARNVETHETATGNFRFHEDPATPEEMQAGGAATSPDSAPPLLAPASVGARGYFNFNLGRVWKVPAKPGRWRVELVLHDVHSNSVEFEVVR